MPEQVIDDAGQLVGGGDNNRLGAEANLHAPAAAHPTTPT
jgi:hypothetical protein